MTEFSVTIGVINLDSNPDQMFLSASLRKGELQQNIHSKKWSPRNEWPELKEFAQSIGDAIVDKFMVDDDEIAEIKAKHAS